MGRKEKKRKMKKKAENSRKNPIRSQPNSHWFGSESGSILARSRTILSLEQCRGAGGPETRPELDPSENPKIPQVTRPD